MKPSRLAYDYFARNRINLYLCSQLGNGGGGEASSIPLLGCNAVLSWGSNKYNDWTQRHLRDTSDKTPNLS